MILFLLIASSTDVGLSASVASSLWGIILIGVSGVALWRTDAWTTASRLGDVFLEDLNRLAGSDGVDPDRCSAGAPAGGKQAAVPEVADADI